MGEDASCLGGGKKGNRFIYVTKGGGIISSTAKGQSQTTPSSRLSFDSAAVRRLSTTIARYSNKGFRPVSEQELGYPL